MRDGALEPMRGERALPLDADDEPLLFQSVEGVADRDLGRAVLLRELGLRGDRRASGVLPHGEAHVQIAANIEVQGQISLIRDLMHGVGADRVDIFDTGPHIRDPLDRAPVGDAVTCALHASPPLRNPNSPHPVYMTVLHEILKWLGLYRVR